MFTLTSQQPRFKDYGTNTNTNMRDITLDVHESHPQPPLYPSTSPPPAPDSSISLNPLTSYHEEPWSDSSEILARTWAKRAQIESDKQFKAGIGKKKWHWYTGLPAILVPTIMATITPAISSNPNFQYVNIAAFVFSGTCAVIHTFFGFEAKYQEHMNFAARYSDVVSDVDYELVKRREFRVPFDAFLMKIQIKMDNLSYNAPDV